MGASLNLTVRASVDSKEFIKHFSIVEMCAKHDVSYPKETLEFFDGAIDDGPLDDYDPEYVVERLSDGAEMKVITKRDFHDNKITLNVKDIPKGADKIIVQLSY